MFRRTNPCDLLCPFTGVCHEREGGGGVIGLGCIFIMGGCIFIIFPDAFARLQPLGRSFAVCVYVCVCV